MNKAIIIVLGILLIGCQNQRKESFQEKIFIELGGEKQYVEMTGASNDLPGLASCQLFYFLLHL